MLRAQTGGRSVHESLCNSDTISCMPPTRVCRKGFGSPLYAPAHFCAKCSSEGTAGAANPESVVTRDVSTCIALLHRSARMDPILGKPQLPQFWRHHESRSLIAYPVKLVPPFPDASFHFPAFTYLLLYRYGGLAALIGATRSAPAMSAWIPQFHQRNHCKWSRTLADLLYNPSYEN
jgi:hypothetical protein